jgi:hypothetical protein
MSTTDRAFNQVKAILGKLDDSIDEARRRRLDEDEPKASAEPVSGQRKFGRAQPLRPTSDKPGRATPLNRWS